MTRPDTPSSPFWTRPDVDIPGLEGVLDTDVLIIGGGITGLTLAYTLAERGGSVGLLDSGPLAGSASGRNAGFLLAVPPEPYRELIALWGRDAARAMIRIGRRSHERVRELVETLGIECDYRALGSLRLAVTEEEAEDQRASLADLNDDGFRMLETPVRAAVAEPASSRFSAAFQIEEDGELDPVRFLYGVAVGASRLGARLFSHSAVLEAHWKGGLWEVRTEHGIARARTLVLATNAYSARLCPAVEKLIAPRRAQMLATAPIDREVASRPTYAHWGYRYWRQLADGRLLIGGWRDLDPDAEVGFSEEPTEPIQRGIEEGLSVLVPEGVAIEKRWAGTMGFARDGRPLVGWLDPTHHVAIAAGYTGHGMGMAAACTLDLAELLAWRRAPGIASFAPSRFPELQPSGEPLTVLGMAAG